ncbi:hypothetical protein ACW9UR_17020 [Halovulum sp. GXIMD14794]
MKARTGMFRTIQRAFLALLLLLPFSISSTFGAPKAQFTTVAEQTAPRLVHAGSAEPRLTLRLADLAGLLDDPDDGPDPYASGDARWRSSRATDTTQTASKRVLRAQDGARAHLPRAPPLA